MLAPSPSQHLESEIRPHGNPPYDSDIPNPALGPSRLSHREQVAVRQCHQILCVYRDQVEVRQDLRGRSYYWIGGPEEKATDLPGSDVSAIRAGLASVTPLGLDLTHTRLVGELVDWQVGNFVHQAIERAKD